MPPPAETSYSAPAFGAHHPILGGTRGLAWAIMGTSDQVPQSISETIARERITIMTRTATFAQYLDLQEAVRYLNSLGFAAATVETVKYHAYYTGKLPRPKIVGRKAHWSRESLDALVEAL
ncbi:hypothetical protein MPRI_38050 [Mycobacterium paraintracellulare]|uniref:Uncharacterized protein n=2 Tax=Mycobacterium paraintracellulare TaxID=1138383 RepID=A0ABN6AUR8_9MYCO|nr:hypothetical protein MPRI_38050 [Mycobacterium paraintracellulare]